MIPSGNIANIINQKVSSKTYKIDFDKCKIVGMTDGLDSIKQAIYLILNTERYEYLIYSFYYGIEFNSLVGKDREYVEAEFKRRIEDALLQDDRIDRIDNFIILKGTDRDSIIVKFDVITNIGLVEIEKVVSI